MEGHSSSPSYSSTTTGGEKRTHRISNPYESLGSQQIPFYQLIYDLPTSPEFLFDEEAATRHRSWSQKLTMYTGVGYTTGAILGGVKGTFAGLAAAERGESMKLRTNRILNAGGYAGRKGGNNLGTIAMIFSALESGIMHWTGDEGYTSTVAAGLGTGIVFRAARGPRSAAVAGVIGGFAAAASVFGKKVVKRYVPI